ncbi:MAG: hypothetical protein ACK559_04335 [bacterium]
MACLSAGQSPWRGRVAGCEEENARPHLAGPAHPTTMEELIKEETSVDVGIIYFFTGKAGTLYV